MMSFKSCINAHVMKGFVPPKVARDLLDQYETLYQRYSQTLGDAAAAHAAAEHFVNVQQNIILKKMENDVNHVLVQRRVKAEINDKAAKIQTQKDNSVVGTQWLSGNPYFRAVGEQLEGVYDRHQSLQREILIGMSDVIEKFRSKAGGFKQDVAGFKDVVRAAMGYPTKSDVGNAAGKTVRESLDKMRQMFEDAGGIMGKIEGYFPVHHQAELVGRVPYEQWKADILPLLDRERMIDLDTALPMDDARLDALMQDAYKSITTNGLVDIQARAAQGLQTFGKGGEVSLRRTQSRFFHFKGPDEFMEYNAKYGRGDAGLFDALMDHVSSMTRDIAIMQKLGPKPNAIVNNLVLEMEGKGINAAQTGTIKGMYDVLSGRTGYAGKLGPMYKFFQGWLNVKRAAYLGSAPISALSDSMFVTIAAKANGIPAVETIGQYMKLLNPADATDREVARNILYIASAAHGMGLQGARQADDVGTGGITSFLAGSVNRISGLGAMTDSAHQSVMAVMASTMASYRAQKTAWSALEPEFRQAAEMFGITERDWNMIMSASPTVHPNMPEAEWLVPENVIALGGDAVEAGRKFGDWITAIGDEAANEPTLLTRAITTGAWLGDARQGTPLRLIMSNVFFAKSFGVTVIIRRLLPALRDAGQGRLGPLFAMAGASLVMGALAFQANQIVRGKSPYDMDNSTFWKAAMLQSGGLGIFGDLLMGGRNTGNDMAGLLAGPTLSTLQSVKNAGNLYDVATGEKDPRAYASGLWRTAAREIPYINLWYSRLLVERGILDQVEKMIDPKYDAKMRRLENRMRDQNGQTFWWRKGELTPEALQ